jgi:hypothetical protein
LGLEVILCFMLFVKYGLLLTMLMSEMLLIILHLIILLPITLFHTPTQPLPHPTNLLPFTFLPYSPQLPPHPALQPLPSHYNHPTCHHHFDLPIHLQLFTSVDIFPSMVSATGNVVGLVRWGWGGGGLRE